MDNNGNMQGSGMVCKCPHHRMVPWVIILIGVDFLLGTFGVYSMKVTDIIWPILLIIAGIVKLMRCGCCSK